MSNLVEIVKNAGITGAGGAGFPTHVKLAATAEMVIVNGAECEPLLRVDQQLIEIRTKDLLTSLQLAIETVHAQKGIIALKKKYHRAIDNLMKAVEDYPMIDIFLLDDFYPAGDEQVLVYEVLNRIVPEGGIPLDVQTVVFNVETLLNIYDAVQGVPVTEKYVTITGAVKVPMTIKVPIGMSVMNLIKAAGGATVQEFEVIDGGPMMGKIIDYKKAFVKKGTKGILVLPEEHTLIAGKKKNIKSMMREAKIACCMCSLCTEACPRFLLGHRLHPDRLMRLAGYSTSNDLGVSVEEAFLCCECGLCEAVCVMGLQPWKMNRMIKDQLGSAGIKNSLRNRPSVSNSFRDYRKFPGKRLIQRYGLAPYDVSAPIQSIAELDVKSVCIDMKQHLGAPAEVAICVGDSVTTGQKIGTIPDGKLSACVHSSITGTVTSIYNGVITIQK